MPSPESKDKSIDTAIAGAVSGFMTRLICQPLDVIKIRFQLQVEPISHSHPSKYRSMQHATATIFHEEGLLALWKGHLPAQYLSISYGVAQFYCYNQFMNLTSTVRKFDQWQNFMHFVAGASAGSIATIVSFPFDTARTRLVAQSSRRQIYTGLFSLYKTILKTESVKSLFRGLSPTLMQIAPLSGLQFLFYNLFKDIYDKLLQNKSETSVTNSMIAGSLSGLLAKTAVYPFDLARKRLQIQGFEYGREGFGTFFTCKGLMDCFIKTVKEEGLGGLYKGLVPSQLKAAATTSLHFTFYEQSLVILRHLRL